jgi:4-hydroxybenzoate polyprenyltransferase
MHPEPTPTFKTWLHFLRLPNHVLLWISVGLFAEFSFSLNLWLIGLSFSLMLFSANAWNDWLDVDADQKNRPGTNPFQSLRVIRWIPLVLGGFMLISFLLGLWVYPSLAGIQRWGWYIWLGLLPGLWAYSKWWQHGWLWKNFSASLLTSLGVLSLGWMIQGAHFSMTLFWLVWLANFWREIAKDLEDAKGDRLFKKGNITRFLQVWHCQIIFLTTFLIAFFWFGWILKSMTLLQALAFCAPLAFFLVFVFVRQWTWVSRMLKIWMGVGLLVLTQF